MPKIVLDLNDRRPAWSMPSWVPDEIRRALPLGWELHVMATDADGSGDGMANLDPALLEAAREAEIYLGYGVPAALLRECRGLRWVHSGAAGVRGSLTPEMLSSRVLFTNSKGIHGPPMADTALGMILHFSRGFDFGIAAMARGRWEKDPFYAADNPLVELAFSTVGIFGFGGIGREVGKRVGALGARVLAFDRGPEAFEASSPSFQGMEPLHGPHGFQRLLTESDFLVITAPETPETRGVFDAAALSRMKPGATLLNISRGRLVDEAALVSALTGGRLRGAGLDVFWEEPLPEGHPLWTLPNVLILPHVSAVSRHFWRREADLILENLRRYLNGEGLLNLVDKEAGF
jgi:phosphoglycerate dehydrogenase-like enzyme